MLETPVENTGNVMRGFFGVAAIVAGAWYFGLFESTTYRAEVGYYENGKQTWYVGADTTQEKCMSEAQAFYSSVNARSPNRAFSWACRKMQGESFVDRVR